MVQTVCMPAKFAALCKKLTENQKHFVKQRKLDRLLDMPPMPIQRMLAEYLADNFNEKDRTFSIRGHVVPISTWDVYCILGLVDKGDKIELSRKQADRRLFDLYKEKGDTTITFKYLEERIPREEDEVHFSRMFVLYAIGTILAPSSKGYIGSNYLEIVADVSKIESLNWARFTLDHLLEHLALFKASKRSGLVGNLAFLQVWYFEHFQSTGEFFDYTRHMHPLIRNWPEKKVMMRARLEGLKKFEDEKVVIYLDAKESKVGDERMRHDFSNNEDWKDKV